MKSFFNLKSKSWFPLKLTGLIFMLHTIAFAQWTDITSSVGGGITPTTNIGRAIIFDFNNDQYPDFLVPVLTNVSSPYTKYWRLYKNNGNSTFSELTSTLGLPLNLTSSIGFIDYNADGYKDLFLFTATGFQIFRNNNGVSFSDVSSQLGISTSFFSAGEIISSLKVFDYDSDSDEDILYMRTISGSNTLTAIVNNGSTFSTKANILSTIPGSNVGGNFSFFDMDNDGDFDIVFDAFNSTSQYATGIISLFRKDAGGYTNVTGTSGLVNGLPSDPVIFDINQDGNLDIVKGGADCCSSPLYRVFIGNGNGVFSDQTSQFAISNGGYRSLPTLTDFDNDADFDFSWSGFTSTGSAPFRLYTNNNNSYTESAATYGLNLGVTSGGVPIDDVGNGIWLDIDKDGDQDILINREGWGSTSITGNVWIKRNPIQGNYIDIKLNGCGVNKSGIGSRVKIVVGSVTKWLYYGNSPDGNNSNGTDIFHFGLGSASLINSITVYWPNNTSTVLTNITSNQQITINGISTMNVLPNGPTTFCNGSSVTLAAEIIPGNSYQWQNNGVNIAGANSNSIIATNSGSYTLNVTNSNGCNSTSSPVSVTALSSPLTNAGPDISVCAGSPLTLNAFGAASYSWSGGVQNGVGFLPESSGTYTVTGTSADGCTSTDQTIVSVYPLPDIYAGIDQQSCLGEQVILTGSGALTYSWSNGVNNNIPFVPQTSSTYILTGTSNQGCTNSDTVLVQVINFLPITQDVIACNEFTWIDGNTYTSSNSNATYYVSSSIGCDSLITLNLFIPTNDTSLIQSTALDAFLLNGITYSESGTYFQTILDDYGCDSTIRLELVIEKTSIFNLSKDVLSVYPNPSTTGVFYVKSDEGISLVGITDALGRNVNYAQSDNKIDISNLQKGCYFARFNMHSSIVLIKLITQ